MDDGSLEWFLLNGIVRPFDPGAIVYLLLIILFLAFSGLFSSTEVSLFSLTPSQLEQIRNDSGNQKARLIIQLLSKPKRLLASLLIANNLVNIAIVIISSFTVVRLFDFSSYPIIALVIQVGVVTLMIVMIGEVLPKIYATYRSLKIAYLASPVIYVADKILSPFSILLVSATNFIDKRIARKGYDASMDELAHAIDMTSGAGALSDEKKILKSIVRFGDIDVKQIMKPRMDIIAVSRTFTLPQVLDVVKEYGYSRIPVYEKGIDQIKGLLYIKDLIPFLDKGDEFHWQNLVRLPYFVPEHKKINDLLNEFREKKMHLAIIVDEYGTVSGLVSLEDILEEIVGEISDEFDEEEINYSKLDDLNYVFEGKILLTDFSRLLNLDMNMFNEIPGDPVTLAGLLIEISGRILQKDEKMEFKDLLFTIESADRRRIKRIKVTLKEPEEYVE
ncbi:MAG: gliding motility-associated protein GldE [Bacteroidia bacterium]|nr:gliding motility-associated protein GldE [Bacteroidia bacterium]MCZ2278016.1 gliding motility-associated protein GldE [Bacteroidia bacterium]